MNAQNSRPKILILITKFYRGGAEVLVYNLAPLLLARYEVMVAALYASGDAEEEQELRAHLTDGGVTTTCIGKVAGTKRFSAILRLRRLLREFQPDILHTHCFLPNWYGRVAAVLGGIRIRIATHHSGDNEWKDRRYWLEKLVLPVTTCHVAVSSQVARTLRETLNIDPGKIQVIPNGIDVCGFAEARKRREEKRRELGLSPSDIALVNVAHIDRAKGQAYLIQAFESLIGEFPTLRLFLAGEARDVSLSEHLKVLVQEYGVSSRVSFLGSVSDVPGLLAAGDIFVLPSVVEGHPVSLLEAMVAGLPVVASDIPAVRHVVEPGTDAVLIPAGDVGALAAGIRQLLQNPRLGRKLSAAAVKKIKATYTIQQTLTAYASLYDELLRTARTC